MSDPKYAYPYPAQGYYQGPPVMAPPPQYAAPPPPPQYAAAAPPPQYAAPPPPPPRRKPHFLDGCMAALSIANKLLFCSQCCCDPSIEQFDPL